MRALGCRHQALCYRTYLPIVEEETSQVWRDEWAVGDIIKLSPLMSVLLTICNCNAMSIAGFTSRVNIKVVPALVLSPLHGGCLRLVADRVLYSGWV